MVISRPRLTPERAVLIGTVLAALAYIQDIRYDFILDDIPLILMNSFITSWRNWKLAFTTHIFQTGANRRAPGTRVIHYRPVYKLWQMLNDQLFGAVIPWWHVTSLLLHIAATLLVYAAGIRLLKNRWAAALAALLFALHPIHAEAVAYLTASTDLLVTLFALIAFIEYDRFRHEAASAAHFGVSICAAALAMLSKESAVMFPWLLVAYEAFGAPAPSEEKSWTKYLWTLPYFAVVGAYLAARTLLFGFDAGPGPGSGSRLAALLDVPLVVLVYLRSLFLPFQLSFYYPDDWVAKWGLGKAAALTLAALAAGYLWMRYRDRSGVRLQLLWIAILFVPAVMTVGIFPHDDWVHDRHMYLASVPICFLAAAILTNAKWPARTPLLVGAAILAILFVDLCYQVPRFTDSATIYASALKVAPQDPRIHSYYAESLWTYGRREEALHEFQDTSQLAPDSAGYHERYAAALIDVGREDDGMAELKKALQVSEPASPLRAAILAEIGKMELNRSEYSQAAAHLREAVQIAPQTLNYHALLAAALVGEGNHAQADAEMQVEAANRRQYVQTQQASRN